MAYRPGDFAASQSQDQAGRFAPNERTRGAHAPAAPATALRIGLAVVSELWLLTARFEPCHRDEVPLDQRVEFGPTGVDLIRPFPDQHQRREFMGSQHFVSSLWVFAALGIGVRSHQ